MINEIRPKRSFKSLTASEILALAITNEEEDARIYDSFAAGLRDSYPATAEMFVRMREAETTHRHRLIDLYRTKFGESIPLIRRSDVRGFITHRPVWLVRPLGLEVVRRQAAVMELETQRFYEHAASQSTDAGVRQLLGDLIEEERHHESLAEELGRQMLPEDVRKEEEETRRRMFVLQIVQPGLAGLMDGSVSTLAPLFAAAFATGNPTDAFRVGLAASIGAGISMGFAEALSDDGSLTGRGHPWIRGVVCGVMTALGGIGHTLPYLIREFRVATTIAIVVVVLELGTISWIRKKYMDTPLLSAMFQVVVGGFLVFLAGILIGIS